MSDFCGMSRLQPVSRLVNLDLAGILTRVSFMRHGWAARLPAVALLFVTAEVNAEIELDRDRFLDRPMLSPGDRTTESSETTPTTQEVVITGLALSPEFDLYLSSSHSDADTAGKEDALSYEWTVTGARMRWAFALTGDLYKFAENESGERSEGFGDTALKVTRFFPSRDAARRLSVQFGIAVPTGADGITMDRTDEFIRAIYRNKLGSGRLTWDIRMLRIGGSIPEQSGRYRYRLRTALDLPIDDANSVQVDVRTTVRRGATAATGLAFVYSKTTRLGDFSLTAIQGVSSVDRGTYIELGLERKLGKKGSR